MVKVLLICIIDLHYCIAMLGNVKGKIVEVACIIAWVIKKLIAKGTTS
jgi:hypothetical protein